MLSRVQAASFLRLISFLALFAGLQGCASWWQGDFEDPGVRLVKVKVVKARLVQQDFLLRFRIDNPNDSSLPVRGMDYQVFLEDMLLAEGESSDWFSVPAHGHHEFDVPVRTNLWRHMRNVVDMLKNPDEPVPYRLVGEVRTGILFGRDVHVMRNGEIIPGNYIPE